MATTKRRVTLPNGAVVEFEPGEPLYAKNHYRAEYISGPLPLHAELIDAAEGVPSILGGRVIEHVFPTRKFYEVYVYTD